MLRMLRRLFGLGGAGNGQQADEDKLTYEQMRELARHPDPKVRCRLAARQDLRPEILYFLAEDEDAEVRRAIAANNATPHQADLLLARDADGGVRSRLAEKIAHLAPHLSSDERDRLRRMAYETLELLARDQLVRVREILAEALKDVADVPPETIRRLAHDTEITVAGPVLENSPVLTDEDLLEIINGSPIQGALRAISRRRGVHPAVCDAIAATEDREAVATLLGNPSAQIREETLDHLIERSREVEQWQDPLVRRPRLSRHAAARLAQFVADHLIEVLKTREDFDAATLDAVAQAVQERLAATHDKEEGNSSLHVNAPEAVARRMHAAGTLDEAAVVRAVGAGDKNFVIAALAVRAGLPLAVVANMVATHSAKGITAACWKAGLSMTLAVQLQTRLAHIPAGDVLHPRGVASYPLTEDEMIWQIEFFSRMGEVG
ncbi:DUF2336 domain-containing protein [Telmatospirillum sp. J64-1]|uniref:DUF2336 domain-containing protein n=1 Tax=Telmatospirillum sp. J64-1 TaxID=2502183 RepID=UPI00115E1B10|nr:DUF2336 domain-containing protein [Telmatospirillum sp. J64-1]